MDSEAAILALISDLYKGNAAAQQQLMAQSQQIEQLTQENKKLNDELNSLKASGGEGK